MVSVTASTVKPLIDFPFLGKPHWRRVLIVFELLESTPQGVTYSGLIEYVRLHTGIGCSRKLISKWKRWKKQTQNLEIRAGLRTLIAEKLYPTENPLPKPQKEITLQDRLVKVIKNTWSYIAATAIVVGIAGSSLINQKPNTSEQRAVPQPQKIKMEQPRFGSGYP